ncbi:MAG TPA: hypothetical protein VMW15_03830 [Terracidiphilus sp.]|nr:hypothetical protein [Terracidiphilus sp.]
MPDVRRHCRGDGRRWTTVRFERAQELVRTATSAAAVAAEAQRFAQEDDISVISVTRTAAMEPALA